MAELDQARINAAYDDAVAGKPLAMIRVRQIDAVIKAAVATFEGGLTPSERLDLTDKLYAELKAGGWIT